MYYVSFYAGDKYNFGGTGPGFLQIFIYLNGIQKSVWYTIR
jgi:hypothetical protein